MGLKLTGELDMPILRKKTDTTAIPELQEYYATKGGDSTAKAWLLAFGSLFLTVAVLVGVFLGGRWIYRTVTDTDEKPTVTTQTTPTSTEAKKDAAGDNKSPATGTDVVVNNDTGTATTLISGGSSSTQPAQGVTPQQTPKQNSTAVAATTSIPNTGSGSIIALFAFTTLIGAYVYRRKLLR